jgi:four helix bundle protein
MARIPPFDAWQTGVPEAIRADALWRVTYRLALYAVEISWTDARSLDRVRITHPVAAQLYRAVGSIAANIAEGYSRSTGPDRARILEYSLGSTRESVAWYYAARPVLGQAVFDARNDVLTQIRRLLLTTIPAERQRRRLSPRADRGLPNADRDVPRE